MAKRVCPNCKKKVHYKATVCPYCQKEITPISFWKTRSGMFLIALAITIGIGILVPEPSPKKSVQQVTSQSEPAKKQQEQKEKAQEKGFAVADLHWERGEYGTNFIAGTLKNNSDRQYSYVQIEFNLYDNSGAQVGSTIANVNNLEPHGTWKFKAFVMENTATEAKIKDISGF